MILKQAELYGRVWFGREVAELSPNALWPSLTRVKDMTVNSCDSVQKCAVGRRMRNVTTLDYRPDTKSNSDVCRMLNRRLCEPRSQQRSTVEPHDLRLLSLHKRMKPSPSAMHLPNMQTSTPSKRLLNTQIHVFGLTRQCSVWLVAWHVLYSNHTDKAYGMCVSLCVFFFTQWQSPYDVCTYVCDVLCGGFFFYVGPNVRTTFFFF